MNFDFIKNIDSLKKLYEFCHDAEEFAWSKPSISATSARKAMEYIVKMIYQSVVANDDSITVFEMCSDPAFVGYINDNTIISSIHYIRKMGNVAVHDGNITTNEALKVLEQLHFLVGEIVILLEFANDYPVFEKPTMVAPPKAAECTAATIAKTHVEVEPEIVAKFGPKMRATKFNVSVNRDEAENKKLYMEACLREAGWPVVNKPNTALPSSVGIKMILDSGDEVDYVLYGKDGKPLALVEYTLSSQNPVAGRLKAIKAADEMKIKYGYKPIIYYTNGYNFNVIDQLGYKPRRVFQVHTIEELELLKLRATIRQDISSPAIDDGIAGRYYQKEAINAVCNALMSKRRRSLLVMATGTGKTRIAIALSDVLLKANWAKNILFLADRTSLVKQAHKNFTKLLPSVTTSEYSGSSNNKDPNARIIFSTYQTMINLIDDDTREFNIGRFDLIIIDEAHRSIFKKYSALFHYFDSLLVGLTATPRNEENKSTYSVFELPDSKPDYAYELETAIKDGYLVGFSVQDKTTEKMKRGCAYDDLTPEQKANIEEEFLLDSNTDLQGAFITPKMMADTHIINLGTINAMLNDLMRNGLKIENGDKIGKTIIFSSSHVEAEKIVERFNALYPQLGMDFCKIIDCQVANNQSLIDNFGERDKMPQIAVSVDMMDTGIDVPDVLNLVFFKAVKSKIKFLQMIGRGTRLSPDVFGPGMDKKGFLVFDYFDNFNYFRARGTWSTVDADTNGKPYTIKPQSYLIYECKLDILAWNTQNKPTRKFDIEYTERLRAEFVSLMQGLCNDDVEVQYNMAYVNKYRTPNNWYILTKDKINEIKRVILPLLPSIKDSQKSKNFDLLIYTLEKEVPRRIADDKDVRKIKYGFGNVGNKIDDIMETLLTLKIIPAVAKNEAIIKSMKHADYLFENFSLENCENTRLQLRDLMNFLPNEKKYVIIDTDDTIIDVSPGSNFNNGDSKSYAEKVNDYLNGKSPALAKIMNLDPLTDAEKTELENTLTKQLGSDTDFAALSKNKPMLVWIRSQIGISTNAIATKFGSFYNKTYLNELQYEYITQMINFAQANGDIVTLDLQKVSPLCDVDIPSLFGDKIKVIKDLIHGIHMPII